MMPLREPTAAEFWSVYGTLEALDDADLEQQMIAALLGVSDDGLAGYAGFPGDRVPPPVPRLF